MTQFSTPIYLDNSHHFSGSHSNHHFPQHSPDLTSSAPDISIHHHQHHHHNNHHNNHHVLEAATKYYTIPQNGNGYQPPLQSNIYNSNIVTVHPPPKIINHVMKDPNSIYSSPSLNSGNTNNNNNNNNNGNSCNTNSNSIPIEDEPIYVNSRQYARIMKRRAARASELTLSKAAKKPYQHESRHQHAIKRARGSGGRFLTKEKNAELLAQQAQNSSNETSPKDSSTPTSPINTSCNNSHHNINENINSTPKIPKTKLNNSSKKTFEHPISPAMSQQPLVNNLIGVLNSNPIMNNDNFTTTY